MWKAIFDSVTGTSHEANGVPCQDSCRVTTVSDSQGNYLVAVCSDGAGSAIYSDIGAAIACDQFTKLAHQLIKSGSSLSDFTAELALEWCERIREELARKALAVDAPVRELACTLLGAIIGDSVSVFMQIGDGAMVIREADQWKAIFWPQSGEYANTTNFLTEPRLENVLEVSVREGCVYDFAAFTDGLERLILRFSDRSVHHPFLTPLFNAIRAVDEFEPFFDRLRSFLMSESINERTNDDKTLILATRIPDA